RTNTFEDSVVVAEAFGDYEIQPSDAMGVLAFGKRRVQLIGLMHWLNSICNSDTYRFYIHFHDNIVQELALFARYDESEFFKDLKLFHTHPAIEGGQNLLGVIDLKRSWILNINIDNQGGYRITFHGLRALCESLRRC
ncbi:MAG: hypothetical protein KDA84_04225, partial [Planctomycetaceae bacterium]|nr:hypothetical protein [Planctomycetaceae bacterium]